MEAATLIRLKVRPGAREDRLERRDSGAYEVWVRAPAERGLANAAALALLARELGCAAKSLRVVKGAASPSKIVARLDVR
ncbi:MAG: DUF167 domain-containing protein [Elusimicrobia bacterium]|nr:DUF167 domain-containing protein [Elusimicrobiota bacterium]